MVTTYATCLLIIFAGAFMASCAALNCYVGVVTLNASNFGLPSKSCNNTIATCKNITLNGASTKYDCGDPGAVVECKPDNFQAVVQCYCSSDNCNAKVVGDQRNDANRLNQSLPIGLLILASIFKNLSFD